MILTRSLFVGSNLRLLLSRGMAIILLPARADPPVAIIHRSGSLMAVGPVDLPAIGPAAPSTAARRIMAVGMGGTMLPPAGMGTVALTLAPIPLSAAAILTSAERQMSLKDDFARTHVVR